MVPRDQRVGFLHRAQRARILAKRYPEAAEALDFYAEVASFQARRGTSLELLKMVSSLGPPLLRQAASGVDVYQAVEMYRSGEDRSSPKSFFARVLLQIEAACRDDHAPPQVGCLRGEGEGSSLWLACSLCFEERRAARSQCPACQMTDERQIVVFSASEIPHIEVRACDACRFYLNVVRLDEEPEAMPDVDEMVAIALDLRAREMGYEKIQTNLVGM
ncbi:MAG TPA: formate dehydrogenase accessory protein FdhE [Vicinamibacteria bacterium]|nr:formate dehydrogenase accessory protein FdhE [Vicinamibacteria bacterium]